MDPGLVLRQSARTSLLFVLAWMGSALAAPRAVAQGWLSPEGSAAVLGRGGAAVADEGDASAAFHDPGGLAFSTRSSVQANAAVDAANSSFDLFGGGSFDREPAAGLEGALHVVHPLARDLVGGLSIGTPWGLAVEWQEPSEFTGRFRSTETRLTGLSTTPVVAWRLHPDIGFAAGPEVVYTTFELSRFEQDPALSALGGLGPIALARSRTDIDGLGIGWVAGVHARIDERLDVAARVRSGAEVDLTGRIAFAIVAPEDLLEFDLPSQGTTVGAIVEERFSDRTARATVPFPAMVAIGGAWRPIERVRLLADLEWVDWSEANRATLVFGDTLQPERLVEGYEDTWAFRAGAELSHGERALVRVGYARIASAAGLAGRTPLLPESSRDALSAGIRLPWKAMHADLGYRLTIFEGRRGVAFPDNRTTADGVYETVEHRFAVGVSREF